KALLASQPSGIASTARPFPALTEKTLSSRAALQKELESVQRKGYAMDAGEFQSGIGCIATTVHAGVDDPSSAYRTTAALSLCVPLDRLDSRLVDPLMVAKTQIMQQLRVNPMVDPPASCCSPAAGGPLRTSRPWCRRTWRSGALAPASRSPARSGRVRRSHRCSRAAGGRRARWGRLL